MDFEQFEDLYNGSDEPETQIDEAEVSEDIEEIEVEESASEPIQDFKNEHNAEMARMRRQQEEQKRIQQARQEARDEMYREMYQGQINPFTGRPINNERDYREYQQAYNQQQLEEAGINKQHIQELIDNDPRIIEAQRIQEEQQKARGQELLNKQVAEITKLDKSITSLDDIFKSEKFNDINNMVMRGYSLVDAYTLANMDKLIQQRQNAVKQSTINQMTGKSHLQSTSSSGVGDEVTIPDDVYAMYKSMNPKATDAQIRANYKKYIKE